MRHRYKKGTEIGKGGKPVSLFQLIAKGNFFLGGRGGGWRQSNNRRNDVSPTDVCPTESSWMSRPLNKASLEYCVPDRSVPTLDHAPSAAIAASVGLRRLMDQWGVWPASPTPLSRFIGLAPIRRMHARPTHRTPPLRSAKARGSWKLGVASLSQIKRMGWFGQGQISLGTLCPRGCNIQEFSVGDTSVGDGLTLHPILFS
jgi:hypothetical protein